MFDLTNPFRLSSTSPFGQTNSVFWQTPSPFGASSSPAFGSSMPAFGSSSTPAFGSSFTSFGGWQTPTPAFGNTGIGQSGFGGQQGASRVASYSATTEADGGTYGQTAKLESISAMPVYKVKSHEELRWEDYQLGDKGSQTPTPAFGNIGIGQSCFGGQRGGSKVASYSATAEADGRTSRQTAKLESISAMLVYKDKSHEDLRWEDYQLGDKGGPLPSAQSTGLPGFGSSTTVTNVFSPSPPGFGQSSANPFSCTTPNPNLFAPKTSIFSFGFGTSTSTAAPSIFVTSTPAATPSIFGPSTSPFGGNSSTPAFGPTTSLFNTAAHDTSSPFDSSNFGNTQPSQLFSSPASTIGQSGSTFGRNPCPFSFSQSSLFDSPSYGLRSIFSSSAPLTSNTLTGFGHTAPSMSTPFQSTQSAQMGGAFSFSNFGQTQPGTRFKFGPASENDRQQLTWFSNACKGIPQVNPAILHNNVPIAPPAAEDPELAMAINLSIQEGCPSEETKLWSKLFN